ncbi:shikimate kinase [Corynebacterium sp. TAE3-ERU12]|uniref:shikimate kinase n=1 Tax=Corynebacterium sp. TAE3-ERU12 TaxID=2849491 RepID=UPI00351D8ED5
MHPYDTAPIAVLVGPPGAGKSTVGRRLARELKVPLTDTDDVIAQRYNKPCGEVFRDLGEEEFRRVEAEIIAEALHQPGILALGGGAVLTDSTRSLLTQHTVIYLEVSAELGVKRTCGDNTRPVLEAEDPQAHYAALLERRRPLYQEVATFRAHSDERSPQRVVAEILSFLEIANDDHAALTPPR